MIRDRGVDVGHATPMSICQQARLSPSQRNVASRLWRRRQVTARGPGRPRSPADRAR